MNTDNSSSFSGSASNNVRTKYYSSPDKKADKGSTLEKMTDSQRPFSKKNILMMVACVAMIILGFALMAGGGSSVEDGFNPDIFSTRRIVVGPTIAFLGFLLMAFAIIYNPDRKDKK